MSPTARDGERVPSSASQTFMCTKTTWVLGMQIPRWPQTQISLITLSILQILRSSSRHTRGGSKANLRCLNAVLLKEFHKAEVLGVS